MKRFKGQHLGIIDKVNEESRFQKRLRISKKYRHHNCNGRLSIWKYLTKLVQKYEGKSENFIFSKFLAYCKEIKIDRNESVLKEFCSQIENHPNSRWYNWLYRRSPQPGDIVIDNQNRLSRVKRKVEKKRYYIYEGDDYVFEIKVIGKPPIRVTNPINIQQYKNMWNTSFGGLSFKDSHIYKDIYGTNSYSKYLWSRLDNREKVEKYYKVDNTTVIIGYKINNRKEVSKKEFMRRFYEKTTKERAEEKKREQEKINTVYNFSLAKPVDWEGKLVRGKKGETVIVYHHLPCKRLRRWHKT